MDFSAFSDEHFNAKSWVNGALAAPRGQGVSFDTHANMLVMKLQTFVQKINAELEDASTQIVKDLPNVIRSIDILAQEVSSLKERMTTVKEDIEHVETDTAHTMAVLIELDRIKSRMEDTSAALQEADNWTTLSADAEEAFRLSDVRKAASTLLGMRRSLLVLSDVPDHPQRQIALAGLENRLEALLAPKLQIAFAAHSVDPAKEYTVMFTDIGRRGQVLAYYIQHHKATCLDLWTSLTDSDGTMATWLPQYHDHMLQLAHEELKFCHAIFPEPTSALAAMLAAVFASRTPPPQQLLQRDCRRLPQDASALEYVTSLVPPTLSFARALPTCPPPVAKALLSGFAHFQAEFGPMQADELSARIAGLRINVADLSPDDAVEQLRAALPLFFEALDHAHRRCLQLTEGAGVWGLVEALSAASERLCELYGKAVAQIRKACGVDGSPAESDALDESTCSQYSFAVVEMCGDMLKRTSELEKRIHDSVIAHRDGLLHVLRGATTTTTATTTAATTTAAPTPSAGSVALTASPSEGRGSGGSEVMERDDKSGLRLCAYVGEFPRCASGLRSVLESVEKGEPLLPLAREALQRLNATGHAFALASVLAPIQQRMRDVPRLPVWSQPGSEDFSLSPLPYITKIGEYLLTLPQQLEPFLASEDGAFAHALRQCVTPFPPELHVPLADNAADMWLTAAAAGTMAACVRCLLAIPRLSPRGARQLSADLDYLCNVLSALEVQPTAELVEMVQLLSAAPDEFPTLTPTLTAVQSADIARLAAMRGIFLRNA